MWLDEVYGLTGLTPPMRGNQYSNRWMRYTE